MVPKVLLVVSLLLGALSPTHAQVEDLCSDPSLPVRVHPTSSSGTPSYFALTPAYRAIALPFPNSDRLAQGHPIRPNWTYEGAQQRNPLGDASWMPGMQYGKDDDDDDDDGDNDKWDGPDNCRPATTLGVPGTAVGGVLSLSSRSVSKTDLRQRLNVNAFATCPKGLRSPVVECYRLIKQIPGSLMCPATYAPQTYYQFGNSVRTWWTLPYTQPGTTFTLELVVRCLNSANQPVRHIDRWVWRVVTTFESMRALIDLLHTNALGTTEVPCIVAEETYRALRKAVSRIESQVKACDLEDARWEVWQTSALILAYTAFTDCFMAEETFSGQFPPGNDLQFGDFGFTGIIDSMENPCACALLANLEHIANKLKSL